MSVLLFKLRFSTVYMIRELKVLEVTAMSVLFCAALRVFSNATNLKMKANGMMSVALPEAELIEIAIGSENPKSMSTPSCLFCSLSCFVQFLYLLE